VPNCGTSAPGGGGGGGGGVLDRWVGCSRRSLPSSAKSNLLRTTRKGGVPR